VAVTRWQPGDVVVVRTLANSDGTVVSAIPAYVASDAESLLTLFVPAGTSSMTNWVVPAQHRVSAVDSMPRSGERRHVLVKIEQPQLRLYIEGARFSLGLVLGSQGWYGNLEAPYMRTPIGVDTRDYALDVLIGSDGTWRWKDEDEFQRRREVGLDSAEHQARVLAAGEELISRYEEGLWPFNLPWGDWKPEPEWSEPPPLPDTWKVDFGTAKVLERAC